MPPQPARRHLYHASPLVHVLHQPKRHQRTLNATAIQRRCASAASSPRHPGPPQPARRHPHHTSPLVHVLQQPKSHRHALEVIAATHGHFCNHPRTDPVSADEWQACGALRCGPRPTATSTTEPPPRLPDCLRAAPTGKASARAKIPECPASLRIRR